MLAVTLKNSIDQCALEKLLEQLKRTLEPTDKRVEYNPDNKMIRVKIMG